MIYGLLGLLGVFSAGFAGIFFKDVYNNRKNLEKQTSFP